MNWFRSKSRSAALLALFALALQMILAFGHLHRDDLGLPPLADSDRTQMTADGTAAPAHPGDQPSHRSGDDYCAICASMVLIASAVPSLPPVLVVPDPVRHTWARPAPVHGVSPRVALSFRARAPPAV
jgi:hypothetical protein